MNKTTGTYFIQSRFPGMSERRMAKIMPKCDCLCQIFIQFQCFCNGSGNLRYLQRMCQSGTIVIPLRGKKYLGFILQPAKCFGMNNPVTVSLIYRPDITFRFLTFTPSGISAVRCCSFVYRKNDFVLDLSEGL